MNCAQRKDLILLDAAGALEPAETAELREHLATGCPQCCGARAEAEATMAQLSLLPEPHALPAGAKDRLLERIHSAAPASKPIWQWERMILPAAVAAILAVAVTLASVWKFGPRQATGLSASDLADAKALLAQKDAEVLILQTRLQAATRASMPNMEFASLTGSIQPQANGHVFIDTKDGKWYFFGTGLKPPEIGRTYVLWVCCGGKDIMAGSFDPKQGSAMLLGDVPPLPSDSAVTIAITDEPMTGPHAAPTGRAQIFGQVQ